MERRPKNYNIQFVNEIENKDLSKLIKSELRTFSWSNSLYLISILGLLALIGYELLNQTESYDLIFQFSLGVVMGLLIIPIHELLHGSYFRWLGCNAIDFVCDFKNMEFSTSARDFVLSRSEFVVLLLFPFVIILMGGIFLYLYFESHGVLILSFVLFHTSLCAGDFALISFVNKIKNTQLRIHYDANEKKTLFAIDN